MLISMIFCIVIRVIQIWPSSCPLKVNIFYSWLQIKDFGTATNSTDSSSSSHFQQTFTKTKKWKKTTLSSAYWSHPRLPFLQSCIYTSFLLMDFIAFTVYSLNDRTQTVNWISPGAALSGLNRYTQQHLFLCPWKWDCLWAHECLCITFFSSVYSM